MVKMLVIAAALVVLSASSSFAAITCWYNGSGADSGPLTNEIPTFRRAR